MNQYTVKEVVSISGIGLHSGENVNLKILPSVIDKGIEFKVNNELVLANYRNVKSTNRRTTIGNGNIEIHTIEHLMSAFMGLKIDNAEIILSGSEIPIMDGSARVFIDLINSVGIKEQYAKKKVIKILKEVTFSQNNSSITIYPSDNFSIDYMIDFDDPVIGIQRQKITLLANNHDKEIGSARTFGMLNEVEYMHKNGLALGGSINNAIVVDNGKVLNPDGLRYKDEFVRHKILDLCGDIYLSGYHLMGDIVAKCAGHEVNNKFLWELFSDKSNYEVIEENKIIPQEEISFAVA